MKCRWEVQFPKTVVKSEKTEEIQAIKFVKHVNCEVHKTYVILSLYLFEKNLNTFNNLVKQEIEFFYSIK